MNNGAPITGSRSVSKTFGKDIKPLLSVFHLYVNVNVKTGLDARANPSLRAQEEVDHEFKCLDRSQNQQGLETRPER
jgi:hypothetical protein